MTRLHWLFCKSPSRDFTAREQNATLTYLLNTEGMLKSRLLKCFCTTEISLETSWARQAVLLIPLEAKEPQTNRRGRQNTSGLVLCGEYLSSTCDSRKADPAGTLLSVTHSSFCGIFLTGF